MDQLADHSLWLAAVTAGLTALGLLLRRTVRGIRWARRQAREWARRFAALEGLVHHELTPNSGSSVKDQLGRIERRLTEVDGRAYLTAGLLSQHVQESRDYLDNVTAVLKDQGINLPHPTVPRELPETDHEEEEPR